MNANKTHIEISKEYLHFAAAHFTIFSATERENLHGHNFHVTLDMIAGIGEDGLTFDYNILKNALKAMCDGLDEQTLMPANSPHLTIGEEDGYVIVGFNGERIPFLPRDVTMLPVRNVTVEELSVYLLDDLRERLDVARYDIDALELKCSSGEGQWASATWKRGSPGQTGPS